MDYTTVLIYVIERGVEGARRDYREGSAKLKGALAGFEACRGRTPQELAVLLKEAREETVRARDRRREMLPAEDFWWHRCREAEIEWVANCVSVILVNEGMEPIVPPTAKALLAVSRIVGVGGPN